MESKQLHTECHPFGQNYHLNINLQLPLRNLKWKLRNGNVTHVPADCAKKFNQILGLLIRNTVSRYLNLLCFTTILKKSQKTKKITKWLLKRKYLSNMLLVNQNYFVSLIAITLNVSQRTSGLYQTPDAENFAKSFSGLIPLNTVCMFDGVLNLSLHLPSVDFNSCVSMLFIILL